MTARTASHLWRPRLLVFGLVLSTALRVPAQSPATQWDFEGSETALAAESARRGYDLVLQGVERGRGAVGKGLHFSGATSSVGMALPAALQSPGAVTVEAWVRADRVSGSIEGAGIVNAGNYLMRVTRGAPSFHVFTEGWRPVLATAPLVEKRWFQLVGTYDGSRMCIYVNGTLAGSVDRKGTIPHSPSRFVLGRQANPFEGDIDQVRIYLESLSAPQVKALFEACCRSLNPGIDPGVSEHVWEGPVRDPVRLPDPPASLRAFARGIVTERSSAGEGDGLLSLQVALPTPIRSSGSAGSRGRAGLGGPAGETGCPRLRLWPGPGARDAWDILGQHGGRAQPQHVSVALSVPAHPAAVQAVWARLKAARSLPNIWVIENGIATDPAAPLASWSRAWSDANWLATAQKLRRNVGPSVPIALSRLPLEGPNALRDIGRTATSARGAATAVVAWTDLGAAAPGDRLETVLRRARDTALSHGLQLWLDASCPASVREPERTIRFLRLLAICHQLCIPVTWWNGDGFGTLDRYGQHTHLSYAAQAWQSLVGAPAEQPTREITDLGTHVVRWEDRRGRPHVVWWCPHAGQEEIVSDAVPLPANPVAVDPLHAQTLALPANGPVPVCRWPLVARGEAP